MTQLKHRKVAILFSGGPAPSANAVISSVAETFLRDNIPVIGIMRGYEFIQDFNKDYPKIRKEIHYDSINEDITRIRNRTGIYLRTSRANPGKEVKTLEDLNDPVKNARLRNIMDALDYLECGVLISIGGDDTLKTANYLWLMGLPVIHIPKTIDNDYYGISWTFGYWTAVDNAQKILLNLKADAQATDSFFIVELMGRKAGWITYAAGISAECMLMISSEDIKGEVLDLDDFVDRITNAIIARENSKSHFGVHSDIRGPGGPSFQRSSSPQSGTGHGNLIFGEAKISSILADRVKEHYREKTGLSVKITPKQVGYETRSGSPVAFDVVMGSMLGLRGRPFLPGGQVRPHGFGFRQFLT